MIHSFFFKFSLHIIIIDKTYFSIQKNLLSIVNLYFHSKRRMVIVLSATSDKLIFHVIPKVEITSTSFLPRQIKNNYNRIVLINNVISQFLNMSCYITINMMHEKQYNNDDHECPFATIFCNFCLVIKCLKTGNRKVVTFGNFESNDD